MKRQSPLLPLLLTACLLSMTADTAFSRASPSSSTSSQQSDEQWAQHVLDTLSLSQKIAQLLVVQEQARFDSRGSIRQAIHLGVGGVRVCQRSPLVQANRLNQLQYAAALPLLITENTDCRSADYRAFRHPVLPLTALAAARQDDLVRAYARMIGQRARLTGVHQIYGPSAEVAAVTEEPAPRRAMIAYVQGIQSSGLLSTPGYHPDLFRAGADQPLRQIAAASPENTGQGALSAGIGKSAPNITVAWPNTLMDPSTVLPSLGRSAPGDGLVTVDLSVNGGAFTGEELEQTALEALQSGADQLVIRPQDLRVHRVLHQAVRDGQLTEAGIDRSVAQVLQVKQNRRLHRRRDVDLNAVAERARDEEWRAMNRAVARRTLTLLSTGNKVLPLSPFGQKEILHVSLTEDRYREDGRYFHRQLKEQNPSGSFTHRVIDRLSSAERYEDLRLGAPHYDTIIISAFLEQSPSQEQRRLLDQVAEYELPIIVVYFSGTDAIDPTDAADASLLAWSPLQPVQEVAAQAVFGRSDITGRLPLAISSSYPAGSGQTVYQQSLRSGVPEEVGMKRRQLQKVDRLLRRAVADSAFPGAAVALGRSGVLTKLDSYGYETYESSRPISPHSQFDLASLTKVIATTTAAMKLYESNRLDVKAPVAQYWPEFGRHKKHEITIRHLLTHTSGLRPFYHPMTRVYGTPFFELARPFTPFFRMEIQSKEEMFDFIARDTLQYEPGEHYRYSDLNMITLAHVVEQITGRTLNDYLEDEVFEPLGMKNTGFRTTGPAAISPETVPTEVDRTFRARLVRGEVHDEAAYIMGGTAGHAGLFSTAHDLALFADMLIRGGRANGHQFLKAETIELFTTPVNPDDHTRALGWDTKSPSGYSSAGDLLGPNSFGHTGFTGTSFWIDPDQDLFVILLTNRVHPTRANRGHIPVRPELADRTYRSIQGPADILLSELLDLP